MQKPIEEAIEIIEKFIPRKIGIRIARYKIEGVNLDLLFLLEKQHAASAITYIKAVSSILERELGLKIKTNLYIEDSEKSFELAEGEGRYMDLSIPNKELREVAMAC